MALEGTLQDMSLIDLFQIFDAGVKTGILMLNTMAHRATLCIDRGQPIDATIERRSDHGVLARGEAAVFELLQWTDATFCFQHDPRVHDRTPCIFRDSASLVVEGMRRLRENQRVAPPPSVTLESRLRMAAPKHNMRADVSIDLTQWRILSQISITNNVREICINTGLAVDNVLRVASDLARLGLIEVLCEPAQPLAYDDNRYTENPFYTAPAITATIPRASVAPSVQPGKTLLNAIMRRVRGL